MKFGLVWFWVDQGSIFMGIGIRNKSLISEAESPLFLIMSTAPFAERYQVQLGTFTPTT